MDDVLLLRWPEDAARVAELEGTKTFRLLLVEPDADPPAFSDWRLDWIRLPADERDIAARVLGLARRGPVDTARPYVDVGDRLFHRSRWVALSPIGARLAAVLGARLGDIVTTEELIDKAWTSRENGADPSPTALRVHLSRLRRRVEPLGLEIRSVRARGFVMQPVEPAAPAPDGTGGPVRPARARPAR